MNKNPMDLAAQAAKTSLDNYIEDAPEFESALEMLVEWWNDHYMSAGHTRLGRLVVRMARNGVEAGVAPNGAPSDNELDQAGEIARAELASIIAGRPGIKEGMKLVANWYNSYFGTAGHKRLGRLLKERIQPDSRD